MLTYTHANVRIEKFAQIFAHLPDATKNKKADCFVCVHVLVYYVCFFLSLFYCLFFIFFFFILLCTNLRRAFPVSTAKLFDCVAMYTGKCFRRCVAGLPCACVCYSLFVCAYSYRRLYNSAIAVPFVGSLHPFRHWRCDHCDCI